MKNIVVFASGEGTNLQVLIEAAKAGKINGEIRLVVSSRKGAGSLKRAERENIPNLAVSPKDFDSSQKREERLLKLCEEHRVDLICLAGYMLKLGPAFVRKYENRIMNVHPALLPAFGGKGMYGMRVHEAVIKSGAQVSGATVHFVNENYDSGPIIIQKAVNLLKNDSPETLAERISRVEHFIYQKAVGLFCDGALEVKNGKVFIKDKRCGGIKRALLSVSDKTGIVDFAKKLYELKIEIVSTSGTYKLLKEAGLPAVSLEALTGFPEIMGGRVKTLNPFVHGAILADPDDEKHREDAANLLADRVDMVVVNLYPFLKTAEAEKAWSKKLMENIDIGGVTLLRAGAKNYKNVVVVSSPRDYENVALEIAKKRDLSAEKRKELALKAFARTNEYETAIYAKLGGKEGNETGPDGGFPEKLRLNLNKIFQLRYGENPHQKSAFYSLKEKSPFRQVWGKQLSYNNLLDAYGSWKAAMEFETPAAAVFKHSTPCGMGTGKTADESLERAWNCDPLSAFGGIIALNRPVDGASAQFISKKFVEVVCAPSFKKEALEILKNKKNLRLVEWAENPAAPFTAKSLGNEFLLQEEDEEPPPKDWKVATLKKPAPEETRALKFAWAAVKHVKSNAIVLASENQTVGIGAGQMSRVDASFMAAHKYSQFLAKNDRPAVLVMASDAFFPFPDAVREAAKAGITSAVQPGGSVRDEEVIKAADGLGISMVFTGRRHFRH